METLFNICKHSMKCQFGWSTLIYIDIWGNKIKMYYDKKKIMFQVYAMANSKIFSTI